ncbi:SnoaL-like protein [Sphaerotilus hippei]|uniref:SnoaL-like protein n=1 Tax=Sphaerotilus hippei TaxID=744406 RepID=A0A318HDP8_9BURK|nr:nuclear transport factor 2 family protein [Sphaerotilus hippei]PXW99369.1 SnoaL-like protein [Sphaerotilus hippei]
MAHPTTDAETRLQQLEARLQTLEAEQAIRACVNRYMALCDRLDARTPLDELLSLFTEDAVWSGRGSRYGSSFGRHEGRAAIGTMLARYMGTPAHFALNVHFLCSELIHVDSPYSADAHWVMLQTSTFADGRSHLNAAQLRLRMVHDLDGQWRIARFETENLFSRPVDHWQSDTALPVPAATAIPPQAAPHG